MSASEESLAGCLLGTAVGDAIGLPCEGLSRARQRRLFGEVAGHRFFLGRGMLSDDTEHACLTGRALLTSGGDPEHFAPALAHELRLWTLLLPAGAGAATLRAGLRLCLGASPERSGVFSAGNGPAMRSPILGAAWGHDPQRLRALVRVSTRLTHTNPKAERAALAVALAARVAAASGPAGVTPGAYLAALREEPGMADEELLGLLERAAASAGAGESPEQFAVALGLGRGVTGYSYHTVPVAVQAWLHFQSDVRGAVLAVVRCGGDTDTTAAIAGGICGAQAGRQGIPPDWLAGLCDWPLTARWMEALAGRLADSAASGKALSPLPLPAWARLPRNLLFLGLVLAHGFRRLAPPY